MQQDQRAGPIDRFGDRGTLLDIGLANGLDEADQLIEQCIGNAVNTGPDDALLALVIWEADMQVQAAALQRVAEFADIVRGENDEGGTLARIVPISGTVT